MGRPVGCTGQKRPDRDGPLSVSRPKRTKNRSVWVGALEMALGIRMSMVASMVGSSTCTFRNRCSRAGSFLMYVWYSSESGGPNTADVTAGQRRLEMHYGEHLDVLCTSTHAHALNG